MQEILIQLLTENHSLTVSGKINKALASKFAEWMSEAWKRISEKNGSNLLKQWYITRALDVTGGDTILKNIDISDSENRL